jgi:hypothetical protein
MDGWETRWRPCTETSLYVYGTNPRRDRLCRTHCAGQAQSDAAHSILPSRGSFQLSLPFNVMFKNWVHPKALWYPTKWLAEMEADSSTMQYSLGSEPCHCGYDQTSTPNCKHFGGTKDSQQKGHHRFAGKAGTRESTYTADDMIAKVTKHQKALHKLTVDLNSSRHEERPRSHQANLETRDEEVRRPPRAGAEQGVGGKAAGAARAAKAGEWSKSDLLRPMEELPCRNYDNGYCGS